MDAVYGGDCVTDDYIETLTPETSVIEITTQVSTVGYDVKTTEKVTESSTFVDDVKPIIEETAENITDTNQNIATEEGISYDLILKYILLNNKLEIINLILLYLICLLNCFRDHNLSVRQRRCFTGFKAM